MNLHLTDSLTSNAPHWLVLAFLAIGLAAYTACGLLVLGTRARRRWHQYRAHRRTPACQLPPARSELIKEVTP